MLALNVRQVERGGEGEKKELKVNFYIDMYWKCRKEEGKN
jgi:hypothetical protein